MMTMTLMMGMMHHNRRRPMHTADIAHLISVKHAIRPRPGPNGQRRPATKEYAAVGGPGVVGAVRGGGSGGAHAVGGRVAEAVVGVAASSSESVVLGC